MASREFRNYEKAMAYKAKVKSKGQQAYVQEFYDFDGVFFLVMVW